MKKNSFKNEFLIGESLLKKWIEKNRKKRIEKQIKTR